MWTKCLQDVNIRAACGSNVFITNEPARHSPGLFIETTFGLMIILFSRATVAFVCRVRRELSVKLN